jgi:hypothetical protein
MSSETSVITTAAQYKVPKDFFHCYRRENIPEDRVIRPYIAQADFH